MRSKSVAAVVLVSIWGCARGDDVARLSDTELAARVRARPGDVAAADALGERYVQRGQARDAAAVLAAAAARAPDHAGLQNHLGVAKAMLGDRDGARTAFDRALALSPALVAARENRARLAAEEGDLAAALQHTREAARLSPTKAEAHQRLGDLLVQFRDFPAAAAAYRDWARLQPRSRAAQRAWGEASLRADRFRDAVTALRAARSLGELSPAEKALLGLALAEAPGGTADATEAEGLLRDALAAGSADLPARYGLGLLAARANRWNDAVTWFRGAVAADPKAERARYRLARGLLKAGRREEAARELAAYDRLFRRRRHAGRAE